MQAGVSAPPVADRRVISSAAQDGAAIEEIGSGRESRTTLARASFLRARDFDDYEAFDPWGLILLVSVLLWGVVVPYFVIRFFL